MDIDECEKGPCDNGGTCFQRSDVRNYKNLPELSVTTFSYGTAAGFICLCMAGFTGKFQNKELKNQSLSSGFA